MSALAVDSVEIETLVYERLDGRDRGWRVELLVEQLTNKLEQKFLLCGCCSGLMRDACLLEKEGKQELRCFVCIPEGVTWQPAQMNRDAINEKIIRCPLKERGCNWTKNVSTVIQHLNDCGKEDRRKKTLRLEGNLSTGGKELRCEFCGRGVRACEMNPHLGECSEFPVDCPNGCSVAEETGTRQMKRGDVPLHLASCPLQTVKCPYWDYGCGEEMERRQLDLHERDSMHTHFKLAMKEIKEMKQKQTESNEMQSYLLNENIKIQKLQQEQDSQILRANSKIKSLEELRANKDLEIISFKKEIKESTKSLSLKLEQTLTETKELKAQFNNAKKLRQKQDSQISQANDKMEYLVEESAYRALNVLSIDENLTELIHTLSSTPVSTGRLDWKIKRVSQEIEKKGSTYSEPFYVGLYKCQVNIEWDYNDTSKVGCFIRIMKGEFDNKLKWPFIYRRKFVLLNQNRNEEDRIRSNEITKDDLQKYPECFQRPTEIRNDAIGTGSFISNTRILTEKYCKGDSISLSITLEQLPLF